MQCSHCRWLNWGHSFLLSKCALGKPLVHLLMCHFGDIFLCRWIGNTACCCGRAKVWVPAIAWRRKCVCCIHANQRQVARAAPSVLFIIQYLRMGSLKNDYENWSGQNRTSRTTCYGHVTCMCCLSFSPETVSQVLWRLARLLLVVLVVYILS